MPIGVFQPTPAIADGRDVFVLIRSAPGRRFNPRPPLLTGETAIQLDVGVVARVSTHARHC